MLVAGLSRVKGYHTSGPFLALDNFCLLCNITIEGTIEEGIEVTGR